jgi:hypothetical protein
MPRTLATPIRWVVFAALAAGLALPPRAISAPSEQKADDLLIVDCLLPGQVRQLGRVASYLTARRPVRTTALECEIRGGEYVSYDRASFATSLKVWLPEAEAGSLDAQVYVGEIYEKGLGLPPDYEAAASWYRRAAEQGDSRAQINLGNLYERGLGVEPDPLEALKWYRKASGLPDAVLIDSASYTSQQAELSSLRAEVERVRGQLGAKERELEAAQRELASRTAALEEGRAELERVNTAGASAEELDRQRAELARLEQELARARDEVGQAQVAADGYKTKLADLEKRPPAPGVKLAGTPVPLAGPTIELIDPPLTATRGITVEPGASRVSVRSGVARRKIVGRVTAPAGLLSLTVNERAIEPNPAGVFHDDVALEALRVPVVVLAVDQQGKQAKVSFTLEREVPAEVAAPAKPDAEPPLRGGSFGKYYALVIGNDAYTKLPSLRTPVRDSRAIAEVLQRKYGFEVTRLENANRYQILSALNELREKLSSDDNLLIYYGGHGELDEVNMRGHWLPVDAEPDSTANWISNVQITDTLNVIRARHVLLVVDACYSGTLTRSGLARLDAGMTSEERAKWIEVMASKRSRTVLTSGGVKPVMDVGGGGHSVFAKALLEVLRANGGLLDGQRLYREVSARVAFAAADVRFDQVPEYAPIRHAGHEAGDFFLLPQG